MKESISCAMLAGLFVLCGCSRAVISKQIREEATPISGFAEVRQNPDRFKDQTIIVGGEVVDIRNHADESTTLVILAFPLDNAGMPENWEYNQGRFMVNTTRFLDPVVYKQGRNVTVAGIVTSVEVEPVGNTKYRYVVLKARQIYLWPPPYGHYFYAPYMYWHHPGAYEFSEPWREPDF